MIQHALKAVQMEMWVFPVEPRAKTPARLYQNRPKESAPWTVKWSEIATNDPGTVVAMWQWCPDANPAIACKPSGLLVVDADIAKTDNQLKDTEYEHLHGLLGPRVDGDIVYDQVCQKYGGNWQECTATYTVRTGSGGTHYYYLLPDGVQASQGSIVKGILDIRSNGGEKGGYVLGTGSVTDKGVYTVENPAAVRPAPLWLVELCRERPRRARPAYAQPRSASFGGLADTVRCAAEGGRNGTLLWAVRAMVTDGASLDEIEEILTPAATAAGLTNVEIRDTIKSGHQLQSHKEGGA